MGGAVVARAVTDAITLPFRAFASTVHSAAALPATATAVVACLVVSVATAQTATAAGTGPVLPALDVQEYTATTTSSVVVDRDAFGAGLVRAPAAASGTGPAVRPVAGSIPTAGGFGARSVRGCAACSTDHRGLDFAAPTGASVLVALPGRVVSAGVSGGYGNQVLVQHADGLQTRYAHLSQIGVRAGQSVDAGARVGAVGSTGVSTGPHLHFEVIVAGTPVDPAVWLRTHGLL